MLPIVPADRALGLGDLNARISGGKLELPRELASALAAQSIRTAPELLSYGASFPSAVAQILGWSPEQVAKAFGVLSEQLGTQMPTVSPGRFSFGARNPSQLDRLKR